MEHVVYVIFLIFLDLKGYMEKEESCAFIPCFLLGIRLQTQSDFYYCLL